MKEKTMADTIRFKSHIQNFRLNIIKAIFPLYCTYCTYTCKNNKVPFDVYFYNALLYLGTDK